MLVACSLHLLALIHQLSSAEDHVGARTDTPVSAKVVIEMKVVGLRSDLGGVSAALFDNHRGFPTDLKRSVSSRYVEISGRSAVVRFEVPPTGQYAVSVFHDENGNRELDTNFIGIPKEGVGVSNGAKGNFGPPKFRDAKFSPGPGGVQQTITLEYL